MPSSTINKPFVLSLGEPAGIGPEIICKCWQARQARNLPVFFVAGNARILSKTARMLDMDIPVQPIGNPEDTSKVFPDALPVLDIAAGSEFNFGLPTTATAALTLSAIETSVGLILSGRAAGLVTAPIQKSVLYQAGFTFPGHTEFLAKLCHIPENPVMMLVSGELRVVPLTIHMALKEVPQAITPGLIHKSCYIINRALQTDFAIENPRIAVAGLNPHAGEDGAMGAEDEQIIRPALDKLRGAGMNIRGPLPADTLFHEAARRTYDAALCMYHDQALIPVKTLDFDGGVNVTLGLPIVRTSPDHGTALDIAGKNLASPASMINALKLARQIYENRHHV